MPRGDRVIVRAFGKKALVRRVWEELPGVVYIVTEENYGALIAGATGLWPVGFPRDDVFIYDATMDIPQRAEQPSEFWETLKPY